MNFLYNISSKFLDSVSNLSNGNDSEKPIPSAQSQKGKKKLNKAKRTKKQYTKVNSDEKPTIIPSLEEQKIDSVSAPISQPPSDTQIDTPNIEENSVSAPISQPPSDTQIDTPNIEENLVSVPISQPPSDTQIDNRFTNEDIEVTKKKSRKKSRRKGSKISKSDYEDMNDSQFTQNQSNQANEKTKLVDYFKVKFTDEKYIRLNTFDPTWKTKKHNIETIISYLEELKELHNSNPVALVDQQNTWKESVSKIQTEIQNITIDFNRRARNSQLSYTNEHNNSTMSLSSTSESNSREFPNRDLNSDQNFATTSQDPKFSNNNEINSSSKASNENRKALTYFLGLVKDEVQNLEDSFKKKFEKALEESKKIRYLKKFIELRKRLGHSTDIEIKDVITSHTSFPVEINNILFAPMNLSRKISQLYTVDIQSDRNSTKQCNFAITGFPKDVENCIDFIRSLNQSESCNELLELDSTKIASMIGRGGTMIRKLECDYKVMINITDNTATVFGAPESISKLKSHLEEVIFKQSKDQFTYKVLDLAYEKFQIIVQNFTGEMKKIGEDTNTFISWINKGHYGRLGINGKSESDVKMALDKLLQLTNTIKSVELSRDMDIISKLLQIEEFATFKQNEGKKKYVIIKEKDKLLICGTNESIDNDKNKIMELIFKLQTTPLKAELHPMQWNLFSKINANKDNSGLATLINKTGDIISIEFYGDKNTITSAHQKLEEFLQNDGHMETINIDKSLVNTIWDNNRTIRQLSSNSDITIYLPTRTQSNIMIIGNPSSVQGVKNEIEKIISDGPITTESIRIERNQIPTLRGSQGSTIKRIQSESGVHNIRIDDNNLVIRLKGHSQSIASAKEMINSVISNHKDSVRKSKPIIQVVETTTSQPNIDTTSAPSSVAIHQKIDLTNNEFFPSLVDSVMKIS